MNMQMTIEQLECVITAAKLARAHDSSLSTTVEFQMKNIRADTHLAGDTPVVFVKSAYAECVGTRIDFYWNFLNPKPR